MSTVISLTRAPREAKLPTDDGFIWPRARAEMEDPAAIRARLGEDTAELLARHKGRVLTTDDFLRLGWSRAQLAAHRFGALRDMLGEARMHELSPSTSPECA